MYLTNNLILEIEADNLLESYFVLNVLILSSNSTHPFHDYFSVYSCVLFQCVLGVLEFETIYTEN